jgi:2-iminobutanoate/2-iminopropanoate deaminase
MRNWLFCTASFLFAGLAPCHAASYSQAAKAGDLLFVSGQLPIDPNTGQIVHGDIETVTDLTMSYVNYYVAQKGFKMKEVVKTIVYLRDIRDYDQMDATYASWFPYNHPPARDVIVVSNLPNNAQIQISCIASKDR